jgi:hypothetical protein
MVCYTQLILFLIQLYAAPSINAGALGANKFDLALQHVNPSIPALANAAGYKLVPRSSAGAAGALRYNEFSRHVGLWV